MMPLLMLLTLFLQRVSAEQSFLERRGEDTTTVTVDQSLLAIQIGGIVGAYVISVAILLSLLLVVGRRLRSTVQTSNYSLQVEMMKPAKNPVSMDPSSVTPSDATFPASTAPNGYNPSWASSGRGPRSHISGNGSVATIDETVVATDRQRAQNDLEKLYAAVMEHDERREQRAAGVNTNQDRESQTHSQSPDSVYTNPFTDRSSRASEGTLAVSQTNIKPPMPMSPPANKRLSKISSLSLFNTNSRACTGQAHNQNHAKTPRTPISLRKLSISSPVGSPDVTATGSYGKDQQPLTPRFYNPGPPPKAPVTAGAIPSALSTSPAKMPGTGRAPAPAPLSLSPATSHGPTRNGNASSLPFRDAFPPQSAPATKTTIIERPAQPRGGPRTGVPTPYSPYMPFTPVTPLTPSRMVTRRQRKREIRENGLRVLDENDLVRGDEDVWGG